jgi:hypothetical protein
LKLELQTENKNKPSDNQTVFLIYDLLGFLGGSDGWRPWQIPKDATMPSRLPDTLSRFSQNYIELCPKLQEQIGSKNIPKPK